MKVVRYSVAFAAILAMAGCGKSEKKKGESAGAKGPKVPVELYVMSQCPFGVRAENAMIPVVKKLGGRADLKIDYIVTPQGDNFRSLHGPNEVTGDIVQLCAKKVAPDKYLDFILCQNKNYRQVATNWQTCAAKTGINVAALKKCKDGPEGKKLLKESAKRAQERQARGSPTIYIAGKRYRGGRSQRDFLRAICQAMGEPKHEACKNIPEPHPVNVVLLTDKRCKDRACQRADRMVNSLRRFFPKLNVKKVDYNTPEGKKLYKEANLKYLPAILFDDTLDKEPEGRDRLRRWLQPAGKYRKLRIGARFDPTAEICDNGKDDTGNGKVDCEDPTCKDKLVCRKEEPKRLDLFVMSHCPYGIKAMNAMKEVLENFKDQIQFHLHFIGNKGPNGKLSSMHGQKEVDDDLREVCAIKHYPKNYKFMDFIWCRNEQIKQRKQGKDVWKECAKDGIDASVIEKCATGEEGKKLLADSFEFSRSLGIGASPTWLANNRYKFSGLDAETVRRNLCQHNKGMKNCDKKLSSKVSGPKGSCK